MLGVYELLGVHVGVWASSIDMWTVWEHVVWCGLTLCLHVFKNNNGTYFPLQLRSTPEARPASSQPVVPGHGPALSGVHCSQPRWEQLCGPVH